MLEWLVDRKVANQPRQRIHSAAFESPEAILRAAKALRAEGYEVTDAHTPFAVHGLDQAIGFRETYLPWGTFLGGLVGLLLGSWFQVWTHAIDWPLNIGGKTNIAWEGLVPVGFEITVLIAAFATVGTLLMRSGLFVNVHGRMPKGQPHARVTDDWFVLLVAERDASFVAAGFAERCKELGAVEVVDGWRVL